MKYFVISIILGLLVIVLLVALLDTKECVSSHLETRHRNTHVTYQTLYGTPWYGQGIPIAKYHPAKDYEVSICDEWAK